jgi:hypothetical protein
VDSLANLGSIVAIYIDVNDLDAYFNRPTGAVSGGVGCRLYQGLPIQIALPQTGVFPPVGGGGLLPPATRKTGVLLPPLKREKLVIHYNTIAPLVEDQAVVFLGIPELKPRTPAVQIAGSTSVSIGASASYTAITVPPGSQDFFGTRTYTWSGDPNLQISNASSSTTEIIFKSDPNVPPGSLITQTITLRETDAEGSSATASMNVVVQYPAAPPPPPDCKQASECQTHPF